MKNYRHCIWKTRYVRSSTEEVLEVESALIAWTRSGSIWNTIYEVLLFFGSAKSWIWSLLPWSMMTIILIDSLNKLTGHREKTPIFFPLSSKFLTINLLLLLTVVDRCGVSSINWTDRDHVSSISLYSGFIFRRALAIPVHYEHGTEFDDGSASYSKCSMYAVNFTDVLANNIRKADPSWPTQSCKNGWEYNFTDVPYRTAATDVSICCSIFM